RARVMILSIAGSSSTTRMRGRAAGCADASRPAASRWRAPGLAGMVTDAANSPGPVGTGSRSSALGSGVSGLIAIRPAFSSEPPPESDGHARTRLQAPWGVLRANVYASRAGPARLAPVSHRAVPGLLVLAA